jgi:hypothetical protein
MPPQDNQQPQTADDGQNDDRQKKPEGVVMDEQGKLVE